MQEAYNRAAVLGRDFYLRYEYSYLARTLCASFSGGGVAVVVLVAVVVVGGGVGRDLLVTSRVPLEGHVAEAANSFGSARCDVRDKSLQSCRVW